jgi:hypothetical protein
MHGLAAGNYSELTYCHQIVTNFPKEQCLPLRDHLHRHHINVDGFLRLGVSEITRLGFKEAESRRLGWILARLLRREQAHSSHLAEEIRALVARHSTVVL